jgi:hypothetical protein
VSADVEERGIHARIIPGPFGLPKPDAGGAGGLVAFAGMALVAPRPAGDRSHMTLNGLKATNVLVATGSGLAMALRPAGTARFLGTDQVALVLLLGIVTAAYAVHVLGSMLRRAPRRAELLYFAACDAAWVLVAVGAILAGTITTARGVVAALALAAAVCLFGWRYATAAAAIPTARAVRPSAMPR